MRRFTIFFIAAGLYLFPITRLSAQPDSTDPVLRYWGNGGVGISAVKFTTADFGLSLELGVTADYNKNLIALKYHKETELVLFNNPEEYLWSAEVLYGRRLDFKSRGLLFPFLKKEVDYSFLFSIGLSISEGSRRKALISHDFLNDTYNTELYKTFGVPVNLELIRRITDNIGLGFSLYSNINKEQMSYGLCTGLYLGAF